MNKNEFIDKVADTADMSKAEAAKAVDAVFDAITKALQAGDDVRLVGFGTFPPPSARRAKAAIRAPVRRSRSRPRSSRNSPPARALRTL